VAQALATDHDVTLYGKTDFPGRWQGLAINGAGGDPRWARSACFAVRLIQTCALERPDLILSCHVNFGPVARLAKRLFGVPYVLVAHGIDIDENLSSARRKALMSANGVWAVSRWTRHRLERLGVPAQRIRIIPNTVSDTRFSVFDASDSLRLRHALEVDEKVILTVARLDPREAYKGYDKVLEALPSVGSAVGRIRYLVVGRGADADRLMHRAEVLGIRDRVTLCGFVSDEELPAYYRLADVFAMPSRGEGFGIVFLEALASGVPVLGGNQDGSVDALADGDFGLLVDPTDVGAITRGLIDLLSRRGPQFWFDPHALRDAALTRFGPKAFRQHVQAAVQSLEAFGLGAEEPSESST
jgi:glycosyltransferase involved in cell wall biosynthesis